MSALEDIVRIVSERAYVGDGERNRTQMFSERCLLGYFKRMLENREIISWFEICFLLRNSISVPSVFKFSFSLLLIYLAIINKKGNVKRIYLWAPNVEYANPQKT